MTTSPFVDYSPSMLAEPSKRTGMWVGTREAVTVGLLLTPWVLEGPALIAALTALAAGGVLWLTLRIRGRLSAPLLMFQGVFYVGYVADVLTKL